MFERFTGRARRVVVQAQHNARRYGHNFIGPEHLFLSVVKDEDDPVSAVLRDLVSHGYDVLNLDQAMPREASAVWNTTPCRAAMPNS